MPSATCSRARSWLRAPLRLRVCGRLALATLGNCTSSAAVVVAFDAADALDDMIAQDLDGLESAIDAEVDREQVTATRRDAYLAFADQLADGDHAFSALNALWMAGVTKDGAPRKSPLNRGQFTGSGMPTTAEVDAVLAEYTA